MWNGWLNDRVQQRRLSWQPVGAGPVVDARAFTYSSSASPTSSLSSCCVISAFAMFRATTESMSKSPPSGGRTIVPRRPEPWE
jgi:hypothetical protein